MAWNFRITPLFPAPLMIAAVGCTSVDLDALNPNSGPERTLVEVDGDTFLTTAYWDAETGSEQALPGGFLSSRIFSVPDGASLGAHNVQLRFGDVRSEIRTFTVTEAQPTTPPRIDRISLVYADFNADSTVTTWLYVQAANGDVDAEVFVNGAVQPTVAHKGLRNDLFGVPPEDLAFPVYHWVSYIVPWTSAAAETLQISVQNTDGQTSVSRAYRMPRTEGTLDRDGDDIPDAWEENGYDADGDGVIDVDLPGLGADPLKPDVFIEVDIMQSLDNPPTAAVWTNVEETFADAPFINPSSDHGINVVIDRSGTVPFSSAIDLDIATNAMLGQTSFYDLKGANFDNAARGRIYHYGIWANARPNGSSGRSDVNFNTGNGGDDFIVSFDNFSASFQTVKSMVETFIHEFGHDLGLRHGGADHGRYKPNHNSVMSYSWQLRTGDNNAGRRSEPVYSPLYYQQAGAHETNGALPGAFSNETDFSTGMGRTLDENCLNDPEGLYESRDADLNSDGDNTDNCGALDLNEDGDTADTINDFSSWGNITFVGPRTNGRFGG